MEDIISGIIKLSVQKQMKKNTQFITYNSEIH